MGSGRWQGLAKEQRFSLAAGLWRVALDLMINRDRLSETLLMFVFESSTN